MDKKTRKTQGSKSDPVKALEDIGNALSKVFKKYTINSRKKAWNKIKSKKGEQVVNKLIRYPGRSLNIFRNLNFREWLEENPSKRID